MSSEQPCELNSLDIALDIAGVEKVSSEKFAVGWKFFNHFDIMSDTPYSCDTVNCELWQVILRCYALKRTGKYASESKVMCLF